MGFCPINKWYIIVVTWARVACMIYTKHEGRSRALGVYIRHTTRAYVTTINCVSGIIKEIVSCFECSIRVLIICDCILENRPFMHILYFEKYSFEILNAMCFSCGPIQSRQISCINSIVV